VHALYCYPNGIIQQTTLSHLGVPQNHIFSKCVLDLYVFCNEQYFTTAAWFWKLTTELMM
jgi:hypothetical protein